MRGWGNRAESTSLRGTDLGCGAVVTKPSADLQWSSGAEVLFLNWGDGAGPLDVPLSQGIPECRPLWLRAVPGEEVDCEASADSPSSRGNRGAACRGICSHSDAMSHGEMAGIDWSTWRKEFSTSVPLPPEGRSCSGEWCVSMMRGGEQEWGRWCYLPLPLPSMLGWITKSLGKRGQEDSDFVSLSGRGWLMGSLSHSFPLKKISCPFSGKLK